MFAVTQIGDQRITISQPNPQTENHTVLVEEPGNSVERAQADIPNEATAIKLFHDWLNVDGPQNNDAYSFSTLFPDFVP